MKRPLRCPGISPRDDRGATLIVALWLVIIVIVLSVGVVRSVSARRHLFAYYQRRLQVFMLAYSAFSLAAEYVDAQYDAGNEYVGAQVFERQLCISRYDRLPMNGDIHIYDEQSMVNINMSSAGIVQGCSKISSRTRDNILSERDAHPFQKQSDVIWNDAGKRYVLHEAASYMTVYGNGPININSAPVEVLEWCGIDRPLAEKIIVRRQGADMRAGTLDDRPFSYAREVFACCTTPAETTQITRLFANKDIALTSHAYRVFARGWIGEGPSMVGVTIEAVLERTSKSGAGFSITYWKEY